VSSLILVLRAVAGHAGQAHLHAHIAKSLRHQLPCVVNNPFELRATGVRVGIGGFAALAAGQLVDGDAGLAALDVPQRLVDAADGIVQYRAVFPVRAVVAGLPDVFDAIGGFADEERLEISLHCGLHQVGALREGGTAVAVKAVLVGGDLSLMRGMGMARVARSVCASARVKR
jgi:hypothetical protein